MNEIYASGGKVQEGFWDAVQMPNSVRSAYGSDLKKLTKHMNGVAAAGGNATATMKDLNNVLLEQGKNMVDDTTIGQKFVGKIASIGSTALSMAGNALLNFGVSWVLQTGIGAISDWINRDQIAIDDGKKSQQTISDTFNEFSKGKTTLNTLGQSFASTNQQITSTGDAIQSVAEKYTALSKGVDKKTNANIGLSDEDYQTYLDISSQLATLYPQLQSGTDAQGNAMLNLGTNAKNAAKSIQDVYSSSMLSANVKIGDELQQTFKGVSTQVDKYQKQVDEYNKKATEYREKQSSASDFKLDTTKLDDFVKNRSIHLDSRELGDEYADYYNQVVKAFQKNKLNFDTVGNTGIDKDGNSYTEADLWITDPEVTEKQLKDVGDEISSFSNTLGDKFSAKASEMESKSASTTALIQDQWKGMADSLGQYLQTTDSFDKLDSNLKTNLLKNLQNLDIESLSKEYDGDALQFMYDKFIMPLSNLSKDQQQAISDVLNIDEAKYTASQYASQVNSAFEKIFPDDKNLQEQWKKNFGLQDVIDDNQDQIDTLTEKFEDAKSKITESDLETLTNGDRDIAYNLVIDDGEAFNTFDELQKRIAETKQTLSEKDLSLDAMQQVVTDTTTAYSSLSTAMSESMSDTGLTADSITAVKTALSSLVSENDAFKDANLDGIFRDTADGVTLNTDAMKQLIQKQRDMKIDDFTKSIKLQNEELAKQNEIMHDSTKSDEEKTAAAEKYKQALSDLAGIQQAQSQYNAQYQQMKDMFSDYNQWVLNSSKETAGTPYNNIVSGLEQAYEDFKNGLTGTDSFKSFAAMISPTGATDPADFAENYAKANRYLQEGDEGVKNFLNDLKSHDLAEFNQQTGEWTIKAHNAAEAAKALATGTDVASAAFGKMQDYGLHDNTVDDVQDGVLKLGDAYTKLADSRAKLKEMEANPSEYSDVRIQAQRDEVQAYSQDIEDLSDNMQYYIEHQADEYNQQRQTAKEAIQMMDEYKKEVLNNPDQFGGADNAMGVANYLEQQMQGYADTYGFDLDDMRQKAAQAAVAYQEALKNATIDNPVKPEFDDTATEEAFDSTVSKIQNGQKDVSDAMETLKGFTSDQVKGIDLFDGVYDSDELKPAEQALDAICQSLGLTKDEASQLGQVLEAMGVIKPEVDDSNIEQAGETAEKTSEKVQSLKDLQSSGDISSDIDLDFDTADMSVDELKSKVDELNGLKAEIDPEVNPEAATELDDLISKTETDYKIKVALDTDGQTPSELLDMAQNDEATFKAKFELDDSGYQEALSYLQEKDVEVKVKTTLEQGADITSLLNMSDEDLSTTLNIDTSQVDSARAELESIQNGEVTVPLTVKLDDTQFSQLTGTQDMEVEVKPHVSEAPKVPDGKMNVTVEANPKDVEVNAKLNSDEVDGYNPPSDKEAIVTFKKESSEPDGYQPEDKYPWVHYQLDSSAVDGYQPPDKSATVTYHVSTVHDSSSGGSHGGTGGEFASGTMLSIARANGTMHNFPWNYQRISPAFAKGDVAITKSQQALVNEQYINGHSESIVRDGVWSMIPGGAHVANLKKGDIIFSAQQTEDLLKRGATPGHARTYAQGTLGQTSLANAFGLGTFKFSQDQPYTNKTSVSSGSGSSQTDKAVQQAAKDVSSAAESSSSSSSKQKEAIDYVEMKIDYITTKLNDYLARAERYNNYVNSNKEYAKAIKTIDELIAANKQASKTYEQKANSVALSEDIKTKVRTGAYEITEYDDATQKLITQYEKWWKKKVESDSNVNSLKEQKKDTAQKKFDSIKTYYENRRNYSASKVSTRQAELDYRENAGYSQFSGRQKYLYNQQYEQARYQYKMIKNEASAYQKQIAIQLKNGTLKKNSTEWFEAQQHLQELNQELYDTKNAMVDAKKELRRLPIKKLQYALDGLTRFGDKIKNILNLKTSRGQTISDKEYRTQAANINDQINNNYKTRQRLLKEQKNYEYGSTEWNDLADQIYECDNNIISLEQDLDDVKRSMLDMHFKPLDDFKDKVDQSITELDFLRNMLNEIKVDSKGNLTDAGYADIALIAQEMKLNKQTIAEYTEGLKKLEASKDQFVSEDEYNEKWKEYTEIIRDAASANHDLTGELVDMYIDGLEKQNDALQDNIDKQIEALKKKKDYWDYDKNIRKQTSELQALRAQAAALEGVTDAASKAKLAKIKADIKDKQDDLDDTVRDHDIEFRTDSLNDFADEAKDTLDKLTENIKSSTEEQQKIVDAMLGTLTTNYDTAYKTINATIKNTGVVMSDTTSGMVSKLDSVTGAVGLVKDAMKSLAETMSEVAKNISTSFPNLSTDSNGKTTNKATNSANSMTDETNGNSNTNKNDSNVQASNTATSIKFKKKTVDGYVDTKVTLKYDITPKNATVMLQWKSSNTSAVTVSSKGVIVGKKAGSTAKITVTDTVSGKSDTCTVKVQKTIAVLEPADGKTNTSGSSGSSDIFKGLSKDTSNKGNNALNRNVSIADSLAYLGYAPTLANQRLLYSNLKGSGTYTGTASQNTWLLQQLRKKGYANGTKNVPLDGLYEVGEEGSEIIVNKQGILLAGLEAGDGVIPHDLTQNLWQLATEGMLSRYNEPSTILDYVGSSGDVDNSVNTNNMNNVINITIEGNADSQTVEQLRGVAQSLLNDKKFVDGMIGKFDKKISKDASKAGMTRRIRS